jgi:hypothetical protein
VLGQIAPGADVATGPEVLVVATVVAVAVVATVVAAAVVTTVVAAGAEYEAGGEYEAEVDVDAADCEKVALAGRYAPVTSLLEFRLARLFL